MEIQRHWRKMQSPMKKQKSAEDRRGRHKIEESREKAGMLSVEIRYFDFRNASHQMQLEKASPHSRRYCLKRREIISELWSGRAGKTLGSGLLSWWKSPQSEQLTLFDLKPPEEPDESIRN